MKMRMNAIVCNWKLNFDSFLVSFSALAFFFRRICYVLALVTIAMRSMSEVDEDSTQHDHLLSIVTNFFATVIFVSSFFS